MKRLFSVCAAIAALFCVASCYDDSDLRDQLKDHESRISKLETLCSQLNTNVSSLQSIVTSLQDNDFVTAVAPIKEGGETIGYTITFKKSGTVTIYNGKDGKDGAAGANGKDGKDGKDGANGQDGKDAAAPTIGVKYDTDAYYWTINGEWLLDAKGNKVRAEGLTPTLKIGEDGCWYVSYDGKSWDKVGQATGDSFFKSVEETETAVILTLADGSVITMPKQQKFALVVDKNQLNPAQDLATLFSRKFVVNYSFEGDCEDAQIIYTTTSDKVAYTNYVEVKIVKKDDRSGQIEIALTNRGAWDDYEYHDENGRVDVNLIAVNGDGQSSLQVVTILESDIATYDAEWQMYNGKAVQVITLPRSGGKFEFRLAHYVQDGVDGEATGLTFDDLFYCNLPSSCSWLSWSRPATKSFSEYFTTFSYTTNNTGKDRYVEIEILRYLRRDATSSSAVTFMRLPFLQWAK